jgi:hypothetical protein
MSIQVDLRSRHILDLFLQELQLPEGEAWDVTKFPYRFRKLHADGAGEEKRGVGWEKWWNTYRKPMVFWWNRLDVVVITVVFLGCGFGVCLFKFPLDKTH